VASAIARHVRVYGPVGRTVHIYFKIFNEKRVTAPIDDGLGGVRLAGDP
jgi:hypothetical protein